jgi:hypothetical protein
MNMFIVTVFYDFCLLPAQFCTQSSESSYSYVFSAFLKYARKWVVNSSWYAYQLLLLVVHSKKLMPQISKRTENIQIGDNYER